MYHIIGLQRNLCILSCVVLLFCASNAYAENVDQGGVSSTEPQRGIVFPGETVSTESPSMTDNSTMSITENLTTQITEDIVTKPPINCTGQNCVRKCCPPGSILGRGCEDASLYNISSWEPELDSQYKMIYGIDLVMESSEDDGKTYSCWLHEENEFSLQKDGKVYLDEEDESFSHTHYCIDKRIENGTQSVIGLICYGKQLSFKHEDTYNFVHKVCLTISTVFLLAILVLYMVCPGKQDIHSKCMMSMCSNLFVGFILLLVNSSDVVMDIERDYCIGLGLSVQFFFLSFYFWLSTLCFEISRIIRGSMKFISYDHLTKSKRRYALYCLYGWGLPFLISMVTLGMQFLPQDIPKYINDYIVRPDIAVNRCWFIEEGGAVYAYYYGLEIALHILNAGFMSHTAYLLHKDQLLQICGKGTANPGLRIHASVNYIDMFKQQLYIYISYVFIWVLNTISLVESHEEHWRYIDFIVSLQGILLFIIVVRPKNYAMIVHTYERASTGVQSLLKKVRNENTESSETEKSNSKTQTESSVC